MLNVALCPWDGIGSHIHVYMHSMQDFLWLSVLATVPATIFGKNCVWARSKRQKSAQYMEACVKACEKFFFFLSNAKLHPSLSSGFARERSPCTGGLWSSKEPAVHMGTGSYKNTFNRLRQTFQFFSWFPRVFRQSFLFFTFVMYWHASYLVSRSKAHVWLL